MATIAVEQAEVGMVLASEVTDRRGRMLIPAGKALEEKYLNALPMWGVTHIDVEGEGPEAADPTEAVEDWALDLAIQRVEDLFQHANHGHPAVAELSKLCVRRHAIEIQGRPRGEVS